MDIRDQLTSLHLSQRLKELNIRQESYFYYYKLAHHWKLNHFQRYYRDHVSAFSVAELGEILINVIRTPEMWLDTIEKKEANIRATILICAIENNLVTEEWRKEWMI